MKQGIYLRKNTTVRAGRAKKKKHPKKTVVAAMLLVVALGVLLLLATREKNPLKGTWSVDGITVYEFGEAENGCLILPSATYAFTYKIEDNNVQLFFAQEGVKNAAYTFHVNGDSLTLTGGNETTKGTFILSRVD